MVAEHGCDTPWRVPQERISEKICEQIVAVHVPQVFVQVLEVPKISSQDRSLQGTVEQILDVPVPEMVEQLVNLPNTVSQDSIQERTAERIADIPVPQGRGGTGGGLQGTDRCARRGAQQFIDNVDISVVAQRRMQHNDQVVGVPVVLVAQVSQVRVVEETAGISQLPLVEKIVVLTDIRTGQGTQTSESLNTAFLRQVTQAEIGALPTSECGRSANLKRITQQPDSDQQQQQDNQPQAARQSARQEREKEKGERKKEERRDVEQVGCEEEGREAEEEEHWQVTPMEVSLKDCKVDDLTRRIPNGEDVYVMMHGRTLKRSEKLNSCGVSDGCTIQITSRLRGKEGTRTKGTKRKRNETRTRMDRRTSKLGQ